jgi:hypothetical protein
MSGDIRSWAAVLALLALPAGPLGAQSFGSDRELADWVSFYYEHPQPARLATAFEYFVASPGFFDPQTRARRSYFFAAGCVGDPGCLEGFVAAARQSGRPDARVYALRTIWLCRCAASHRLIEEAARVWGDPSLARVAALLLAEGPPDLLTGRPASLRDRELLLGEEPPDLLDSRPAELRDLDYRWASFYATGERAWVERIAEDLPGVDSGAGAQRELGRAARAGLVLHAVLHGRVMDIVRELQGAARGEQARRLAAVLRYADRMRNGECTVADPCTLPPD